MERRRVLDCLEVTEGINIMMRVPTRAIFAFLCRRWNHVEGLSLFLSCLRMTEWAGFCWFLWQCLNAGVWMDWTKVDSFVVMSFPRGIRSCVRGSWVSGCLIRCSWGLKASAMMRTASWLFNWYSLGFTATSGTCSMRAQGSIGWLC